MRGAEAASDADWGPPSMACSRWQASARKKRRPEAISEDLSQLLSTAKAPGGGRLCPPWAAHVLAAGCAAQQPRNVCAGSSQRPEIIRPRRSRRTPLLHAARRPARGRARSGGWRRRHGSMKRCAGCSRARNHSGLGARAARNTLALLARRTPSGRRPAAADHARAQTHTHPRERHRPRARNAHEKSTQCFSP